MKTVLPLSQPVSDRTEDEKKEEGSDRASKQLPNIESHWKEIQGANNWEGLLDPIDERLRAEIIRYGVFTQVCYDSFDSDPYSKYCGSNMYNKRKLFDKLGMSSSGYEVTKYLYATSESYLKEFLSFSQSEERWSSESNWMGYVAVCTSAEEIKRLGRRDILVCWRGTKTATEWAENLHDFLIFPAFHLKTKTHITPYDAVKVESGFLSVYSSSVEGSMYNNTSARDQLLPEIQRLLELYKHEELSITIAGHSLGGALANLSAYDIARGGLNCVRVSQGDVLQSNNKVVPITAFTFGCPRVGNRAFRHACEKLGVKILRTVNVNDIVPKVPGVFVNETLKILSRLLQCLPWTYFHVGIPILVNNERSPLLRRTVNLQYLHNMETYLHLMDGYQGPNSREFKSHGRDPALVNKNTGFLVDGVLIPPEWWQEENKGLRKNEDGMWVQPEREEEDKPHNCRE